MPRARQQPARRSGFGTVRRLASGRWQARWTNPDQSRSTASYDTEETARQALTVHHARTITGEWRPAVPITVTLLAVWDRYTQQNPTGSGAVERKREQFRSGFLTGTALAAQKVVSGRRVRRPLGEYRIGDVTRPVLAAWVRDMITEGLATSTIEGHWSSMRAALAYALDEALIDTNPAANKPQIPASKRQADQSHPYLLTLPEMIRLTQAAYAPHALFVETLLWSGMRMSEARALDGADVNASAGLVRVDEAVTQGTDRQVRTLKPPKTISSFRRVPIPGPIVAGLAARDNGQGVPLFPGPDGGWWDERRAGETWTTTRERAGVVADLDDDQAGRRRNPGMHATRSTVASLLFMLGSSVPEVLGWIGHADSAVTLRVYATVDRGGWTVDPVVQSVKTLNLPLAEAWTVLYEQAWSAYGETAWLEGGNIVEADDSTTA